ncbi:energy-coupling factor transporter ATPase [Alkalihalobacillus sp. MEB130]|uniref:energy-coupling factor transporter ATPase n=1 Tax=Alkalihalobacillus sp. MEB130 TaxID=2976704 RepID=UPI0028DFE114|nr:energy-coupling factor transporter ATPase [Alkalihalobacillus sp. MEB130]MDT8862261.1 energy-coupling factor transporter ATPase [Alkalihalobacillus sp. MEB130]
MSALISLNGVSYQYEQAKEYALKELTVKIEANEWIAVLGRNGSGKSTFGRLLNGLLLPIEGSVLVSDLSTKDEQDVWSIRKKVGMVFQNPDHQFVATTVRDDLAFGLENLGLDRSTMEERITEYASLIGITHLLEAEPHRLSGGQKQRVAIAGIMAMEPDVIVFDEATSMLDPIGRKEVMDTIAMLHQRGVTIISITHDMEEAVRASRLLLFHDGELAIQGRPQEVFSQKERLAEFGLSLPFSIELQHELEKSGITLPKTCLTEEELVAELWTLYSMK